MEKDYIRDNGKIRRCDRNIAKMGVFEFISFSIQDGYVGRVGRGVSYTLGQYKDGFSVLGAAFINTVALIFFPLTLVYIAVCSIRKARKAVAEQEKG